MSSGLESPSQTNPDQSGDEVAVHTVTEPPSLTVELDDREGRFAVLTGSDDPDAIVPPEPVSKDEIRVIPLDGTRDADGRWVLTVPPTSAATPAIRHLKALRASGRLALNDDEIDRIAYSAVRPGDLDGAATREHRTEYGWLYTLETRLFTPMTNVAYANDRLVAQATFEADPKFNIASSDRLAAVPMPESHGERACIVYTADERRLLQAADLNFVEVLADNRQEVGARLIERPVTLVPTLRRAPSAAGASSETAEELTAVDGNCRISSALEKIPVAFTILPDKLKQLYQDGPVPATVKLLPSMLMGLTLHERRDLIRRLAKHFTDRLNKPRRVTDKDLRERNEAASAINALSVPAEIIVGFVDDDPALGKTRFASAVRSLLQRMNVSVKPFDAEARDAVNAEEAVLGLHDAGHVSDSVRDVLIGRARVADGMVALSLSPILPDLRFALVIYELTRRDSLTNKILRDKLHVPQVHVRQRSGPVVELGLRGYTASLGEVMLKRARTALSAGSGCLWQDLVNHPWEVVNVADDEDVDLLEMYALEQRETGGAAIRLLGVLGLVALTTTGNLQASRGSAEQLVDHHIERGDVGSGVVAKLLRFEWGIKLLADAIKRSRAREKVRWVNEDGKLVDNDWGGADFDANLRLAVKTATTSGLISTPAAKERVAFTRLSETVQRAADEFEALEDVRKENGSADLISWIEAEATLETLDGIRAQLGAITEPKPLRR